MKVDKILFVSDSNLNYLSFWNAISRHHYTYLGIKCKLFFIGNKTEENKHFLSDEYGQVEIVEPIEDIPIIIQALWAKFWFTQTEPETNWLIGDIDMFLLNKNYIYESTSQINEDEYGHIYKISNYYPGFLHFAKGKTFKKFLELSDSFEDDCRFIYETRRYGLFGEYIPDRVKDKKNYEFITCEEKLSTERLLHKNVKSIMKPELDDREIMFSEHLFFPQGVVRDPSKYNLLDFFDFQLKEKYYWFHCPRPYTLWKDQIEKILNIYY